MRFIHGLPLGILLCLPALASAQDAAPTAAAVAPGRIVSDPTYLPLAGQIYGQTHYTYGEVNGATFDAAGGQSAKNHSRLNTYDQTVAFGITDDISVRGGIAYAFGTDRRVTSAGSFDTARNGFENPTFGATWRALDQRRAPVSFDLFGDWAPDIYSSRISTGTRDGTVASGGAAADVGAALGHQTRMFTIRGVFTERYQGRINAYNPNSGLTTEVGSYWTPSVGVQTQTRFTPRLSANIGYDYVFQKRSQDQQTVAGLAYVNHIGDTQTVNAAINYHLVPNRLVGSIGYYHTFYDGRREAFADPTNDILQNRSGDAVTATLRYVFR